MSKRNTGPPAIASTKGPDPRPSPTDPHDHAVGETGRPAPDADSADSAGGKGRVLGDEETDPPAVSAGSAVSGAGTTGGRKGRGRKGKKNVDPATESDRGNPVQKLEKLTRDVILFHTAGDVAYANFLQASNVRHRETHAIKSKMFRGWLSRRYYVAHHIPPPTEALHAVIHLLEAQARYDGKEQEVFVRIGVLGDRIYVDLGDPAWRAVEIDAEGWRVIDVVPVRFRRPAGMLRLPDPVRGGRVDELLKFINLENKPDSNDAGVLVVGYTVAAIHPRGPHFVMELGGEHGTAKSSLTQVIRGLVDPAQSPIRGAPSGLRDLAITASNNWCPAFDNLSNLPRWFSDALCRLSTGGGFSTRELYTDGEEVIFDARRPVILNGIENLVTRGDLLSRTISLTCPHIAPDGRRTEEEFWLAFEQARPRILGALYDAISMALRNLPDTRPKDLPRMADAVRWVTAAESALGWKAGTFLAAYERQRAQLSKRAVDADVLGSAITDLLAAELTWSGTATDLLDRLVNRTSLHLRRRLPATAASLGQKLRRLRPDLQARGIEVVLDDREGHESNRIIHLRRTDSAARAVGADRRGTSDEQQAGTTRKATRRRRPCRQTIPQP